MRCTLSSALEAISASTPQVDVRLAGRKQAQGALLRREQLMNDRLHAATLRKLFPQIEHLRIELVFDDPTTRLPSPSPQLHTLYSAAAAFFRFACPCADCDGEFDLTAAVSALHTTSGSRQRPASSSGQLSCHGVRFRDRDVLQSGCPMELRFKLVSEPYRGQDAD
jgi:hypothetical protein